MSDCPSRETLQRLLDETLPPGELPAVEAHVQCCPRCQEVLAKLTPFEMPLARSAVVVPQGETDSVALHGITPTDIALPRASCDADQPVSALPRDTRITADRDRDSSAQCGPGVDTTASASNPFKPGESASRGVSSLGAVGDYELLEQIGRGGMGVVYKARQRSLDRIVALKMIGGGQLASDEQVQRFRAEAQAAAHLDHPGIVPIFEVGQWDDRLFYSMGYVEGPTLEHRLRDQPLPPREAAELVRKIAEAVDYAHGRQVIHRDLKPANVLVDETGQPKVTDFGLAKRLDAESGLTLSGQIMGTPSYMAPEQAAGRSDQIGPAADIYALGGILYALLTGKPPFRAATVHETIRLLRENDPASPRLLNPAIDRDLDTICLKCLEKNVSGRYASAAAMSNELRRYLSGEPILARPIGGVARFYRWYRRKPVLASFASATVLLLVILVFVGTVGYVTTTRALHRESEALTTSELERGKTREALEREKEERQHAQAETRRAEKSLYFSRVRVADQQYRLGDLVLAEEQLDACRPDLRSWEWNYLKRLCHQKVMTFETPAKVQSVAISPDGSRIASGGSDGSIRVWDRTTGHIAFQFDTHQKDVPSVAFSPDAMRVAAVTGQNIVVLDAQSGREARTLNALKGTFKKVAFDTSGARIISLSREDSTITFWDTTTGKEVGAFQSKQADVFSLSREGQRLASGGADRVVRVWNTETGQETAIPGQPAVSGDRTVGVCRRRVPQLSWLRTWGI